MAAEDPNDPDVSGVNPFFDRVHGRDETGDAESEMMLGLAVALTQAETDARIAVLSASATLSDVPEDTAERLVRDLEQTLALARTLADEWADGDHLTEVLMTVRSLKQATEDLVRTLERCYPDGAPFSHLDD